MLPSAAIARLILFGCRQPSGQALKCSVSPRGIGPLTCSQCRRLSALRKQFSGSQCQPLRGSSVQGHDTRLCVLKNGAALLAGALQYLSAGALAFRHGSLRGALGVKHAVHRARDPRIGT
jgi:hypothetical protein